MDPRTVHVDAVEAPKLFADHDLEDPPEPEWRVLSTASPVVTGATAAPQPIVSQYRRPPTYGAGVAIVLSSHRTRVFSPPM